MKLNPDTILKRRSYLRLSLNSSDEVQVSAGDRTIKCGLHALAILELFSRPLRVAEAIKQLGARYEAQGERVAAIATLFRLHEGGALRDVSANAGAGATGAARVSGATEADVQADAEEAETDETAEAEASGDDRHGDDDGRGENPAADEIYFECPLDEPVPHLVPYRERDARDAGGRQTPSPGALELNPRLALQIGDDAPAHLSARLPFLDRFSPRRPLVWVEDAGTGTLDPYWLTRARAQVIEQLGAGRIAPAELDAEVAARFAEARILIAPEAEAARAEAWQHACAELRRDLQIEHYAVLRKIIHPLQLAALRRYFRALDERGHLKASSNKHYAHRRRSVYDEETARFVQGQITPLVNRITPAPVRPSHCQVSVYQPGAFLRRHKDQPQYVWNLSLVVDAEPETEEAGAWPICVEVGGRTREVRLEIGDAVLYSGSEFTHWRNVLPDGQSITLLFCFFSPDAGQTS
jgi:Rps23 Pro-64 3,4-dihydroxylase Tpa1-like proline 4-hydroxylase